MVNQKQQLYVCYAGEDVGFVRSLANDLMEAERSLLVDFLQVDQYDNWTGRRIALETIKRSVGVIVCLSQNALTDKRFMREIKQAQDLGKRLYPLLIEKCRDQLAYYDETKNFASGEIFNVEDGYTTVIHQLTIALRKDVEKAVPETNNLRMRRRVISDFLPRRSYIFVDREHELILIGDLLKRRQSILIQGLGGIGKTRLAVEISHRIRGDFPGGVLWLSAIDHPSVDSILNALAIAFEFDLGGMQTDQKKLIVRREISSTDFLLVFDDAQSTEHVSELLNIVTSATLLCTGRPPLYVPGIQQILLGVLTPPYATELFEAVSENKYLGQERAIIDRICQLKLEGYPLAIELAANQIRVQSVPPKVLLDRIERKALDSLEVPYLGSIRTPLLTTIEQLNANERIIFWSLAVFAGRTFTQQAVEYINIDIPDVTDHLFRLVAYSLIHYEHERFNIHPLLKQFAAENVHEEKPFVQMVKYYIQYAEAEGRAGFQGTEEERPNLAGALDWSFEREQYVLFLGLIDNLLGLDGYYSYWAVNGYWDDATKRLGQAIKASTETNDEIRFARYQLALGLFLYWIGNHTAARNAYASAESFFAKDHDEKSLIKLYWQLGYIEDDEDNYVLAKKLYQKSLELAIAVGDKALIGTSRELVAVVEYHMGNYSYARKLLETGLKENLSVNDLAGVTRSQRRLAAVIRMQAARAMSQEERNTYCEESRRLLAECLSSERNKRSRARAFRQLGMLDLLEGKLNDARVHLDSSLAIFEQLGNKKGIAATLHNLGQLEEILGNLVKAEDHYRDSLDIGLEINVKMGLALNLRQLGFIAHRQGRGEEAEALFDQSITILRAIDSPFLNETVSKWKALEQVSKS